MAFDFNVLYRFWFLIILNALSIVCSLFVLYHLVFDRNLRKAMNNHIIIILLFIGIFLELTDIPYVIHFYRFDDTWQFTVQFSQFWTFIDYGFYSIQMLLFAWATIERHILIFHDQWLSTKKKRFFLHYLPIIIIIVYCLIYYLIIIVFLACDYMNYQSLVNGVPFPCVYEYSVVYTWDLIFNQIVSAMITAIFSVALLIRVLYQKARLFRQIQWRKQRKMTIQLLSVTILYQVFNFPWAFLQFCYVVKIPIDTDGVVFSTVYFLPYYLIELFPFVCCGMLPDLNKKIRKLFFIQRQTRVVQPATMSAKPEQIDRAFQNNA